MSELHTLLERHEREKHAFLQLTEVEQTRFQALAYDRYSRDAWAFLTDCVWTRDQVDPTHKIKPYPCYLDYLRFFVETWVRHKLIAVPKSRRMTMSWTCLPLHLWDIIFNPGSDVAVVSKKQDDAGELVERAEFVFKHIPEWRIPKVLLPKLKNERMSKDPPVLHFEDILSKMTGFPMGADQLRQFTFTRIFGDECAFWEQAEEFYSNSKPTLDGGGGMTLVSSRSPGFFKKIVFDKIDHPDYNFPELPPTQILTPMQGVEIWKNPGNGFVVIDLHYTANPAKRGTEWVKAIRSGMPIRKFMREYEKSWQTFEGLPVFPDFNRPTHVVPQLEGVLGLPLLVGWDFGLTPAAVICQLVNGNLCVLHELVSTNEGAQTFAPKVWQYLAQNFLQWTRHDDQIISFIDPAGFTRSQTDVRTCASYLRLAGFRKIENSVPSNNWEDRKGAVEHFLLKTGRHGAGLQIDSRWAPVLIEGLAGGYQYPEKATENEPNQLRPIKNAWSHPNDALQYVAAGALMLGRRYNIDVPTPSYSFQKRNSHGKDIKHG